MTATFKPTVLEDITLDKFIQYLLNSHGTSSTLVVCARKDAFVHDLQAAMSQPSVHQDSGQGSGAHENEQEMPLQVTGRQPPAWTAPTLRLLASAQTLKLAFCEDITHLRAYLAAYPYRNPPSTGRTNRVPAQTSPRRILALLNPIHLHRETSNFSVQGLNRAFSIAVDAARASASKLVIAECIPPARQQAADEEAMGGSAEDSAPAAQEGRSIWDQEISILNVATKTFGAGERGWVGRTVKVRDIVRRWCVCEEAQKTEV